MADEIPNQNVIRIYRSPADDQWRAHIGPDDGRGVEELGLTPCQALGRLISHIHGGQYAFDPSWCPVEPGSVAGVNRCLSQGYNLELTVGDTTFECIPGTARIDPAAATLVESSRRPAFVHSDT